MSSISNKFLVRKTKRVLRKGNIPRSSISYENANSIGILFTVDDRKKHEEVKRLIKIFEKDGKKVDILCLLGEGKENYDFIFDYFKINDFSFFGHIITQSILLFVQKKFDFLLYLDTESNIYTENILARSNAKCRVGIYQDGDKSRFYELMIKLSNDVNIGTLIDQMYHYIKFLN